MEWCLVFIQLGGRKEGRKGDNGLVWCRVNGHWRYSKWKQWPMEDEVMKNKWSLELEEGKLILECRAKKALWMDDVDLSGASTFFQYDVHYMRPTLFTQNP